MLAVVQQDEFGTTVRLERRLKHSVEKVWSYLTDNDKLTQWFSELKVEDLCQGGRITFDLQDGTFEEFEITDYRELSVLEYTWGEDRVRFELHPEAEGCRLVLIETITKITDHTPKDIAGWDVCLDVIEALLDGRTLESRKDAWSEKYEQYVQVFKQLPRE
ncbi:SRPBCC family protein [Paenibacillus sp. NPDC093718]|uniref:SRPBCC family protein n=1 Tax=Paenibacillus sp. NPDC093718 TaxID=3390601 RepID=UPI003D02AB7F